MIGIHRHGFAITLVAQERQVWHGVSSCSARSPRPHAGRLVRLATCPTAMPPAPWRPPAVQRVSTGRDLPLGRKDTQPCQNEAPRAPGGLPCAIRPDTRMMRTHYPACQMRQFVEVPLLWLACTKLAEDITGLHGPVNATGFLVFSHTHVRSIGRGAGADAKHARYNGLDAHGTRPTPRPEVLCYASLPSLRT